MISLKIETMAGNLPAIYFLEIVQSGGSVEQKGVGYRERRHRLHHDYGPGNDHRVMAAFNGDFTVRWGEKMDGVGFT